MKKLLALLMVCGFAFAFVACGGGEKQTESDNATPETETPTVEPEPDTTGMESDTTGTNDSIQ